MPGLGQMYNGQLKKGVIFFLLGLAITSFGYFLLFLKPLYQFLNIFSITLCTVPRIAILIEGAVVSYRLGDSFNPKEYNKWYYYILYIVIMGFFINLPLNLVTKEFMIHAYSVPTGAMENSILVGDFLLANHAIYRKRKSPENGDVIIFKYPGNDEKDYVKRCVAGPMQTVEIHYKDLVVDSKKEKFKKTAKHVHDGKLDPYVSNFTSIVVPSAGDTIYTNGLQINKKRSKPSAYFKNEKI